MLFEAPFGYLNFSQPLCTGIKTSQVNHKADDLAFWFHFELIGCLYLRHVSIERTQPKFADFALALMEQQVLAHLMSIVKQQIKRLMYVLPIWCLFVQYRLEIKETLANLIISEPIHFCSLTSPEIFRTIPQHFFERCHATFEDWYRNNFCFWTTPALYNGNKKGFYFWKSNSSY